MNPDYNTPAKLAQIIDQTLLKPEISSVDLEDLCDEAIKYGFKTVAVNTANVSYCAELLKGSIVGVDAAISFPLGQCTLATKLFETEDSIKNGTSEVDYVINISKLKERDFKYLENEMKQIVELCSQANIISKAIFENCYLTPDEIETMARIAMNVHPTFIKTSTGFGKYGARAEDVKIMKRIVGNEIQVKAAGGIRSLADAEAMIEAGATRLGTSCGPKLIYELQSLLDTSAAG